MNKIIVESAQGLAVSFTITILIAVFVVSGLKLMFRIMDKIEKGQKAFGLKIDQLQNQLKCVKESEK